MVAQQNLLEHVNSYCVMWMSHGICGMTAQPCFMLTAYSTSSCQLRGILLGQEFQGMVLL